MTPHPGTFAIALALTFCSVAAAQAPASHRAGPPLRVEVEPNALQRLKNKTLDPMTIEVWGAGSGATVHLEVLQDCDGDHLADRQGTETCDSPLKSWASPPAGPGGHIRTELDFAAQTWELPENVGLWLRVSRSKGDEQGTVAPFGLLLNPCDLWSSLVDTFFGGDCDAGLLQALRKHKGPAGLEDVTFEVRRLTIGAGDAGPSISEPITVPGTLGATGIAWADASTLLVTRAPVVLDVPAVLPHQERAAAVPPGLYRVRLAPPGTASTEDPELLWKPEEGGLMPAAPFALPDGRIALVRQSLVGDPVEDEKAAVLLSFWSAGALEAQEISLPYRIHQILAASKAGDEVLALSLGVRSNRPLLLRVYLDDGRVEVVGYHHGLYNAALRSPDGKTSAISMDDASGRWGWELVLVDRSGEWVADLVHRKKLHDLMAAWGPKGGELAYLAEVSRIERRSR